MYGNVYQVAGMQPLNLEPTTDRRFPLGLQIAFNDSDFFGTGLFVYGKAAAAIPLPGRLNYFDFDFSAADIPNTANSGAACVVNPIDMPINSYGWFQLTGQMPVQTQASVAAGVAVGVGAAGKAGTNSAGKQLLGARVQKASTYAPTQVVSIRNGTKVIRVSSTAGLFPGLAVTGTGVGASAVITDVNNNSTISVDVASTATSTITATFTWTGFLLVSAPNGFFVQGAIT